MVYSDPDWSAPIGGLPSAQMDAPFKTLPKTLKKFRNLTDWCFV